jgi:hypothetical protein
MKFVWKGKFKSYEDLPVGTLPEGAVKFKEPSSFLMLNIASLAFVIPALLFIVASFFLKSFLWTGGAPKYVDINLWGFLAAILTILPHEFLHAVIYPKDAEVEVRYSPKHGMAFVTSVYPVSKNRFLLLCLFPFLILGILPLVLWICLPFDWASFLFTFSAAGILFCCGDFVNVYNTMTQMPKNTMTQLSGFNSYWWIPGEIKTP